MASEHIEHDTASLQPEVIRSKSLEKLHTPELSPEITVWQGTWSRKKPLQYGLIENGRKFCQTNVAVNVIQTNGTLYVPDNTHTTFEGIFDAVRENDPSLFDTLLLPGGTAKSATGDHRSPIKALIEDHPFPGEEECEGWDQREVDIQNSGKEQLLGAQLNGQFFNRKSALITSNGRVITEPDASLAEKFAAGMSHEEQVKYGINEESLKRPLLFMVTMSTGEMKPLIFSFTPEETYAEGIARLEEEIKNEHIVSGVAGSPPLVIPDSEGNPQYLTMADALTTYAANDTRHYLYSPYKGSSLLFPEISRMQGTDPSQLVAS
ncbi:hypothetical protein BH09PAT2_BH09PAT2_03940 [soil metagenome]